MRPAWDPQLAAVRLAIDSPSGPPLWFGAMMHEVNTTVAFADAVRAEVDPAAVRVVIARHVAAQLLVDPDGGPADERERERLGEVVDEVFQHWQRGRAAKKKAEAEERSRREREARLRRNY